MNVSATLDAPICQIAYVVNDLNRSIRAWADRADVGPWFAYTLGPPRLRDMVFRGAATTFTFRHALAWSGETQVELVQPLSGPTLFAEHLDTHGEGLHHVGIVVPDHQAASEKLVRRGFVPLQSASGFGLDGSGRFAYFEPPAGIGGIVELIDPPVVRADPEHVYP